MGLALLVAGLIVFVVSHLFVRSRDRRARVIAALGATPYHVLFGAVSTLGLVLIVWGFTRYRNGEWVDIWFPPNGMRHVTVALMLPAFVLLHASVLRGHLSRWAKYPALAAVKLWALSHLVTNGDLGSVVLFGGMLAWAVIAWIMRARDERSRGVPRETAAGWSNDIVAVVAGIVTYLAIGFVFHPLVIGVPVFGA